MRANRLYRTLIASFLTGSIVFVLCYFVIFRHKSTNAECTEHLDNQPNEEILEAIRQNHSSLILNAPTPPSNESSYVIFVISAWYEKDIRQEIRETWASARESQVIRNHIAEVYFIVGQAQPSITITEADVLHVNIDEKYENLLLKELVAFYWLASLKQNGQILKIDGTDVVAHLDRLTSQIAPEDERINCLLRDEEPYTIPIRDKCNKWHVSKERFPYPKFPSYCAGPSYMLPIKNLPAMLQYVGVERPINEDVYITGILAERAGVEKVNQRKIFNIICPDPKGVKASEVHEKKVIIFGKDGKQISSVLSKHCYEKATRQELFSLLKQSTGYYNDDDGSGNSSLWWLLLLLTPVLLCCCVGLALILSEIQDDKR